MKHKKKSVFCGLLTIVAAACFSGLVPGVVSAQPSESQEQLSEAETTPVELENVDKSKGVTYIYSETGSLVGINLNGNSAIIQPAEKPDYTGSSKYCKIYIDTNGNGVVDSGETAQKLPSLDEEQELSEYILVGPPIYGVYKEKATESIVINAELSGQNLYGVFEGEASDISLDITGNASSVFTVNDSTVTGNVSMKNTKISSSALFVVYNSTVTGNVTMTNHNISADTVMATYNGTVTGDITMKMSATSDFIGSCGTVFGANSSLVTGKVSYSHDGGTSSNNEYAVYSGYVHSDDTTAPAVTVDLKNGTSSGNVGAVQGAEITSKAPTAVKYTAKDHKLSGYVYIINGSQVKATGEQPVALDLDVTGASQMLGSLYGIYMQGGSATAIGGGLDANIQLSELPESSVGTIELMYGNLDLQGSIKAVLKNVYANSFYAAGGYYSSSQDSVVSGDITVDMTACQITGGVYMANNSYVKGSVTMTGDKDTCLAYYYPLYYSTIDKSVNVYIYGANDTSKTTNSTYYGCNYKYKDKEYSVGQNMDIKLLGGIFYYFYGANNDSLIAGNLSLALTGVKVTNTSSCYGANYASIGGNLTVTADENCSFACSIYGANNSSIAGDFTFDIKNTYAPENTSVWSYLYGLQYTNVGGNADIKAEGGSWRGIYGVYSGTGTYANSITGTCTISYKNMTCASYIYGVYYGSYLSDVSVTVKNIKDNTYMTGYSCYLYGLYGSSIAGKLDMDMSDIEGAENVYFLGGGSVAKNITANISNISATRDMYLKSYDTLSCGGDITITANNASGPSWYGIGGEISCAGKLTLTATDCSSTQYTYVSSSSGTAIAKGIQMDFTDCSFKNMSSIYFTANGDNVINFNGGSVELQGQISSINGSAPAKVNINFEDVDITMTSTYNNTTPVISNYSAGDMVLEILFDDKCTFPESYNVTANTCGGACPTMVHMGKDYYFAGKYPITAELVEGADKVGFSYYTLDIPSITAKNVIFDYSNSAVAKDSVVTATEGFVLRGGAVVIEGTLKGSCDADSLELVSFYMNGGTIEDEEFNAGAKKYYPATLDYDKDAMSVTHSFVTIPVRKELMFASESNKPSIVATIKTGYQLKECTVQVEGEENAEQLTSSTSGNKTTLSFDMVAKPVAIKLNSSGIPIVVGKIVADPVAELNKEYTAEAPLYDFTRMLIYNDSVEENRVVTYELAEGQTLPDGLTLEDGKLIGTPTAEDKTGSLVKFVVTGKNKSTAEVTLNIIVSSDQDAIQDNQDGRIVVDDVAKTINCMGSSVIIKECDEGTAIYLDDNRDGIADHETPAVKGDYSRYTLYGLKTYETTNPIQIIMESGTLTNIYVVYGGKVTTTECGESVRLLLKGGKISSYAYGVSTSSVASEGVYINCTGTTITASYIYSKDSSSACEYGYVDNNGKVTIIGNYTFDENLEATQLIISAGLYSNYSIINIPENVKVSAPTISIGNYNLIYNKGTLECTGTYSASSYSRHFVIGDAKVLPEDNTFSYLYYPMTLTYDALPKGAKVPELKANYDNCKYDGVIYGSDNINTSYINYDMLKGYTAYYSINDGEEINLGTYTGTASSYTSVYPTCVRKPMNIKVFYVPNELEASVKFSVPAATIGTEYTAEAPLYDYTTISLKNDTASTLGTDVTYKLLPGSKLPDGLSLTDGKVVGTPTGEDGSEISVTVIITGRNGASVEVTSKYVVLAETPEEKNINDMISFDGSVLDLKGTSVVMYADATASSYVNIYLDENHDGIADSNKAFTYKDSTAVNLSNAYVYGYRDTEKAYDGDISIYANGGTVSRMFGAFGADEESNVVVNGTVSLYMNGTNVNYELAAGYYATAKELNLYCKAGTLKGNVYAAYYPGTVDNVHFSFIEDAYYNYYSSSSYMAVTVGGKVTGDVTSTVGGTSNSFNSSKYSNCMFNGVYKTNVAGNVNYIVQGDWYTYRYNNNFANEAVIAGNMNVDWRKGRVSVTSYSSSLSPTFANNCTIKNLNIRVAENANISSSCTMYPYYAGTIENVYMEVPSTVTSSVYTDLKHPYSSTVTYPTKSGYIYNRGTLYVMGDFTLDKDIDASAVYVYENANLTIAEGTTLAVTGSFNGYGNTLNNGTLKIQYAYMYAGSSLTNKGTMNVTGISQLYGASESGLAAAKLINDGTMATANEIKAYGPVTNTGIWTSSGNVNLYAGSSVKNTGEWNSKGQVIVNTTDITITNDGVWTADNYINVQKAGTKLVNNGELTTNNRIYLSGEGAVITNTNIWNMNYGVYMQSGSQIVNDGSFVGKFNSTSTYDYISILSNSKITNNGTWEGNEYININNATFDNTGIMDINPRAEGSTYNNFYMYSSASFINRENATCNVKAYINNSSGKIINYGTFNQTYDGSNYGSLGTVYAAKPLNLSKDIADYTRYTTFYYPATVDYPETAVTGETLATVYSSGVEDDENRYLKAGSSFTVTLSGYNSGYSSADVQSVIYGTAEAEATPTSTENQWQGTMPYEAMTVTVNIVKNDATQIEINPVSAEIEELTVNTRNSNIYDLTGITITGDDDEAEGSVSYAVSTSKPLPEGLVLSNGIISGTPKKALSEPYTAEIIVTGKNLTKATFELTFNKIEKAVPSLSLPTGIYGYTDYTLAQVRGYSNPSTGTYSWPDSSLVITEKCIAGEKFDLYFTPNDTDNYDWSKLSSSVGTWNEEEGRVECKVGIRMYTIAPTFTVPTDITAVYGQTLEDVELPSDDAGSFRWRYPTSSVGNVGTRSFYAYYEPKDTDRYSTMSTYISVKVNPKEIAVPVPTDLKVFQSNTIGQVELPEVDNGSYKWVTASATVVEENQKYKLAFIPNDITNYSWITGDGVTYSNAYGGYVFEVSIEIVWHEQGVHTYTVKHDDTYHWKECICGDIIDKKLHTLGTPVDNYSTHTQTCTVEGCGYSLDSAHSYTKKYDDTYHWSECACGDIIGRYTHSFTKTFYNETSHWKECSCGAKNDIEEHNYVTKSDETEHWKECSCGAKSDIEEHSYTETIYDTENHWKECSCGAKNDIMAHSYGEWINDEENNSHYALCDCGSKKTAEHRFGDFVSTGDKEHKQVCGDCDKMVVSEHTWDAGKVTTKPTTTTEGVKTYTCTICKETKTEPIEKLSETHEHTYGESYTYDEDNHWKECDCGDVVDEAHHTWDEGTILEEATVAKPGTKQYTCEICGGTKIEVYNIEEQEHTHIYGEYISVDANNHKQVCTDETCGNENISKHSFDEGVITTTPSETAEGVMTYTCEQCGYEKTESIDKLPHTHSYGKWVSKDASTHKKTCSCGNTITENHRFNDGVVTVQPTEIKEGVKTYTCTVCGYEKTETIDVLLPSIDDGGGDNLDDDLMEAEPEGTELTVLGSDAKYIVINPERIDPEDEDDSACVVYVGNKMNTASTVTIPDTIVVDDIEYRVISIADEAFKDNKKITKVIIGENVKLIGNSAFYGCTALNTVTFKKNAELITIGKKAFYKCTSLKKIIIPKLVETIKDSAFYGCKKLASVSFQSGSMLEVLEQKAFAGCTTIKKITIPKNVTTIGANVFFGCKKLSTITIQSTKLKKVGKNAFKGIKSTARIRVPSKNLKSYQVILKNKGQGKNVKITK